jgi:hypothetical protein
MTSNEARAETLEGALRAGIERDREALQALFTDDVRAWTPALSTTSLRELIDELDRRDEHSPTSTWTSGHSMWAATMRASSGLST